MMDMSKVYSLRRTTDAQGNPEPCEDLFKDFKNFLKQAEVERYMISTS